MITLIQDIFSYLSIAIGVIFLLIAGIGIIRLPDFYIRMSAITKAGTMGVGFIVLGISIHFNDISIAGKSFVIISFMLLTSPVAAHIISRAAYKQNVPFWKNNLFDQLAEKINELRDTEEAVSVDSDDIDLKWKLIGLYTAIPSMMGGSSRKAIIIASDILDLNPAEGHLALGTVYMKDREFNLALEEFLQAVEISGRSPRCVSKMGECYHYTGDSIKALECFREVIDKNPKDFSAVAAYGKICSLSGIDLKKGEELLIEALENQSSVEPAVLADISYYLGLIYFKQKDKEKAGHYFKKAIEYRSGHAAALDALKDLK